LRIDFGIDWHVWALGLYLPYYRYDAFTIAIGPFYIEMSRRR